MCEIITATGNQVGTDGEMMSEDLEMWKHDPVECVKELIGNPAFRDVISYVPERAFADKAG
jgi:hypothetical protein